jgi:hypothetical protein
MPGTAQFIGEVDNARGQSLGVMEEHHVGHL